MIRRFVVYIVALTICFGCFAQSAQSDRLFAKGMDAYRHGDYTGAIGFFTKADELDQREVSPKSGRYGYCKSWIAYCYYKLGNETKAKEVAKFYYNIEPVDRSLTVISDKYGDLGQKAFDSGDYASALTHFLKCMEEEENNLGVNSLQYVGSCHSISLAYSRMGDDASSLKYCNLGLSALASMGISNDVYTFQLLQGRVYAHIGLNMLAMTIGDMAALEKICGYEERVNSNYYPRAIIKILAARIELQRGTDFGKAAELNTQAFNLLVDCYKPDDEERISSITDCLSLFSMMGIYAEGVPALIENAISVLEQKGLSDGHKGILLSVCGDFFNEAEKGLKYYVQAADCLRESQYRDMYYSNQTVIADGYVSKGEYPEAIRLFDEVCDYYSSGDRTQGTYRRALMNLGDLYYHLGQYEEAAARYRLILSLLQHEKQSPDYVLTFIKWLPIAAAAGYDDYFSGAGIAQELKEILPYLRIQYFIDYGIGLPQLGAVCIPFFQMLLYNIPADAGIPIPWDQFENQLTTLVYSYLIPICSKKHRTTLLAMATLARLYNLKGNPEKAVELMTEVVETAKGEEWENRGYLYDLATYQYESGDKINAYENFRLGCEYNKEDILHNYRWMTVGERTRYTQAYRGNLDIIPKYAALAPEDRRYAGLAYNALLFTKGLLLNSSVELAKLLQEEGDSHAVAMLAEWRGLNLMIQASESVDDGRSAMLKAKADELEKRLLDKSKTYGDYTKGLSFAYEDIQRNLGNNDVAIELCSYREEGTSSRRYGALLLTKTDGPRYVDIGSDGLWKHVDLEKGCYRTRELFDTMFANIKEYLPLKDSGNIFFAPDGIFHSIAVENLHGAEVYSFRRLSSTREIALADHDDTAVSSMVLFGGINYGLGEVASFYPVTVKGKRESEDFLIDLPGTKKEVDIVASLLSDKIDIDMKTGNDASKTAFLSCPDRNPDIIHIATHGFFNRPKSDFGRSDDGLASSGLYFAGAQNTIWDMDTRCLPDNGVLTTREISSMDLRGVKLAVLSACDTGRGIIHSDGVFGLQRGFKQAGTKGIMMSLWKVDDDATQLLMSAFYTNLLSGASQYEALEKARIEVRKQYPEPEYWAAFVLIDADCMLKI